MAQTPPEPLVPDMLRTGLRLVFCGTALGKRSAAEKAYYAHPGNRFWKTLHATGITLVQLRPADYMQLLALDIGLTDLCKHECGNDDELSATALRPQELVDKVKLYRPALLAFTSKKAGATYLGCRTGDITPGLQAATIGETKLFVLPSSSGSGSRYWDERPWHELADHYKAGGVRK